LRQLVKRAAAQHSPYAGHARITGELEQPARLVELLQLRALSLGAVDHAAELDHPEASAIAADSGLAEEDGSWRVELDCQSDNRADRCQQKQARHGDRDVERALD